MSYHQAKLLYALVACGDPWRRQVLQCVHKAAATLQKPTSALLDKLLALGALEHASDALKDDREIVLEAVKQNWLALEYASAALKDDREIVLEAVKQDGSALRFASAVLKNDREIVLKARGRQAD